MPEKYASYMCKICLRINFTFDIGRLLLYYTYFMDEKLTSRLQTYSNLIPRLCDLSTA